MLLHAMGEIFHAFVMVSFDTLCLIEQLNFESHVKFRAIMIGRELKLVFKTGLGSRSRKEF
jgi:hypothetical protein